jgi:putative intracellular protease/amidase
VATQPRQLDRLLAGLDHDVRLGDYDGAVFVGGQGPMYTFYHDERVHKLVADFYEAGKATAVICHATCLLKVKLSSGRLLVEGKTWTGLANSEEQYADDYFAKRIQPFWIERKRGRFPTPTSS